MHRHTPTHTHTHTQTGSLLRSRQGCYCCSPRCTVSATHHDSALIYSHQSSAASSLLRKYFHKKQGTGSFSSPLLSFSLSFSRSFCRGPSQIPAAAIHTLNRLDTHTLTHTHSHTQGRQSILKLCQTVVCPMLVRPHLLWVFEQSAEHMNFN